MKKLIILIFILITVISYSQSGYWYSFSFDDTCHINKIEIDTTSNPNNIWQIGCPNKTEFDSANSFPNCIVTDTANPYPINDTSIFIIKHIVSTGL